MDKQMKKILFTMAVAVLPLVAGAVETIAIDGLLYSVNANQTKCLLGRVNDKNPITRVCIRSDVVAIDPGAFFGCKSLLEVIFESGSQLQRIGCYAFRKSGIQYIRIPSSVEYIGECCFKGCESLSEVTFESGCKLQRIDKDAFRESGIRRIQIP
jgi:hypothetical protein